MEHWLDKATMVHLGHWGFLWWRVGLLVPLLSDKILLFLCIYRCWLMPRWRKVSSCMEKLLFTNKYKHMYWGNQQLNRFLPYSGWLHECSLYSCRWIIISCLSLHKNTEIHASICICNCHFLTFYSMFRGSTVTLIIGPLQNCHTWPLAGLVRKYDNNDEPFDTWKNLDVS